MTAAVVVVGAGVAGTAAALAASRAGARVVLVDGGTGASTLSTGALDFVPWYAAAGRPWRVPADATALLASLDAYVVPDAGAMLPTTGGVVRAALGHDGALLDVRPLAGKRIGVVRCDRPGWDADALARAWGDAYVPLDATVLRHVDERVAPDADFAGRHDDPARLGWLAERLREALSRASSRLDALVLPASLGVERARAAELARIVGVPCGEAIGLPGGPSGLRFERARDRALEAAGVQRASARAIRVEAGRVATDHGADLDASAVVLATGGLLGGGIAYSSSEWVLAAALPPFARVPFQLTIEAPLALGAHGRPLHVPGSLFGIPPESLAWPFVRDATMDAVGVVAADDGRAAERLYVAGDLLADAPRTWLQAFFSGVRAGAAAAREAVTPWAARSEASGGASPSRS